MLCRNDIAAKDADRAMIAEAMARFNGQIIEGEPCKMTEAGLKHQTAFVINDPHKPKKEAAVKAVRVPREPKPSREKLVREKKPRQPVKQRQESIDKAARSRSLVWKKRRAAQATALAVYAGLGDGLTKAAAEMGICRNTARKIARENNIKFTDGRKAQ